MCGCGKHNASQFYLAEVVPSHPHPISLGRPSHVKSTFCSSALVENKQQAATWKYPKFNHLHAQLQRQKKTSTKKKRESFLLATRLWLFHILIENVGPQSLIFTLNSSSVCTNCCLLARIIIKLALEGEKTSSSPPFKLQSECYVKIIGPFNPFKNLIPELAFKSRCTDRPSTRLFNAITPAAAHVLPLLFLLPLPLTGHSNACVVLFTGSQYPSLCPVLTAFNYPLLHVFSLILHSLPPFLLSCWSVAWRCPVAVTVAMFALRECSANCIHTLFATAAPWLNNSSTLHCQWVHGFQERRRRTRERRKFFG